MCIRDRRNLYLTMQLMELDCPMVLALNMMDEVAANGGTIDVNLLESMLGIPVVPISAAKNEEMCIRDSVQRARLPAEQRPLHRHSAGVRGPVRGGAHREGH